MKARKGLYLFERIVFAIVLLILIILGCQPSNAQPPFSPQNRSMLRMDSQEACWQSSDLGLTEDQTKALEDLQRLYMAEAVRMRRELMSLRFELRHLIRDPSVQSKILLDRQKKISELQGKLDNLSLSYQMKARSTFTKEQLEQFPHDCLVGMSTGYEMLIGAGRGPRRGLR